MGRDSRLPKSLLQLPFHLLLVFCDARAELLHLVLVAAGLLQELTDREHLSVYCVSYPISSPMNSRFTYWLSVCVPVLSSRCRAMVVLGGVAVMALFCRTWEKRKARRIWA
jgi:hypothetical protein